MIHVNCRSTLGVPAGNMNPQGLVDYLIFCKLCMQEPLVGISFNSAFTTVISLSGDDVSMMLCLCRLRPVTKYLNHFRVIRV